MRLRVMMLALLPALVACVSPHARSGPEAAVAERLIVPGGAARGGGSIATMSDQYARPRAGRVAATGASAWVEPAPASAFVFTGPLPPAAPPAPPPAAVANRQPSEPAPRPAVAASDIARPEAAAPDAPAPAPAPNAALRAKGLALFGNYSCGACHTLADAGATGAVGPSLDGNPRLTKAYVVEVVTTGRGPMPSFAGQMSDQELSDLADYIVGFSRK